MNYRSLLIIIFHLLPGFYFCFAQNDNNGEIIKIPVWDVFEVSFTNKVPYKDPFRDVFLDIKFTKPDGEIVSFWGFYDGEHTWKARFMPDMVGKWKYFAMFSDKIMAGEGEFEVVPSEIPGVLAQDVSNSTWFGHRNGKHTLVRCLHTGDRFFASNWPEEERNKFLDWSQNQGYNTLSVASFFLNRNVEGRGKGWNTPSLWDKNLNIPQPLEYEKAETIIKELAQRGIIIYPFAGFFGQSSDFPHNCEDQELYLKYTMARLAPFWNMIFNVAGPEPLWRPDAYDNKMPASEIIRLGVRINELDPFDHILSVHNETGTDPFRHEAWHGYVTLQGGKENPGNSVYQYIIKQAEVNKPVFAQEVFWPGNKYHGCDCNDVETIRKKAYILLFAGATINFADMDGNSSSGFSGSLDLDDRHQEWHDVMKSAWDWFESIPYFQMNPEKEIIENGYLIAEPGVRYAIYIPDAQEPVKLDLKAAPGKYMLRWFNTRTNKYEEKKQIITGGSAVTIGDPPGEAEKDWIVLIENTSPKEFYEVNGEISVEAEHAVANLGWEEVKGLSGKAMRDIGLRNKGFLDYPLVFNKPGKYYIYMLMRRTNAEHSDKANHVYLSFAGKKVYSNDGITRPEGIQRSQLSFTWESTPIGPSGHTPSHIFYDPIHIKAPAPGIYTLRITSLSPGFEVDKIVIKDKMEKPDGPGPDETIRKQ